MEDGLITGDKKAFVGELEALIEKDQASIKNVDSIIQKVSKKQDAASRQKVRDLRRHKKEIQKSLKTYETYLGRIKKRS